MANVLGITLKGDTTSFVRSMDKAVHGVLYMNHSVTQSIRAMDHYERSIEGTRKKLVGLTKTQKEASAAFRLDKLEREQQHLLNSPLTHSNVNRAIRTHYDILQQRAYLGDLEKRRILENDLNNILEQRQQHLQTIHAIGRVLGTMFLGGLGSVMVGDAIANQVGHSIEKAANFEQALVKSAMVGNFKVGSEKYMEVMNVAFEEAAKSKFKPEDVANQIADLMALGFSQEKALSVAPALTKFMTASMGVGDKHLAKVLAIGMNKLEIPQEIARQGAAAQAAYISDLFTSLRNLSPIQMDQFMGFLESMGPASKTLGVTTEELFAVGGAFSQLGMSSRQAAEALKTLDRLRIKLPSFFTDFAPAGKGGKVRMEAAAYLGLDKNSFKNLDGTAKSGVEILRILGKSRQELLKRGEESVKIDAAMQRLFGETKGTNLLKLIESFSSGGDFGFKALDKMTESMTNAAGATERAAKAFEDSFGGLMQIIIGLKDTIWTLFGQEAMAMLKPFAVKLRAVLESIIAFLKENKQFSRIVTFISMMASGMLIFGGAATAALAVIGGMGILIGQAVAFLSTLTLPVVLTAVKVMAIGLAAAAFSAIILGTALAIVAKKIKPVYEIFKAAYTLFKNDGLLPKSDVDSLKKSGLLDSALKLFDTFVLLEAFWDGFSGGLERGFERIKTIIDDITKDQDFMNMLGLIESFNSTMKTGNREIRKEWRDIGAILAEGVVVAFTAIVIGSTLFLSAIMLIAKGLSVVLGFYLKNKDVLTAIAIVAASIVGIFGVLVGRVMAVTGALLILSAIIFGIPVLFGLTLVAVIAGVAGIFIAFFAAFAYGVSIIFKGLFSLVEPIYDILVDLTAKLFSGIEKWLPELFTQLFYFFGAAFILSAKFGEYLADQVWDYRNWLAEALSMDKYNTDESFIAAWDKGVRMIGRELMYALSDAINSAADLLSLRFNNAWKQIKDGFGSSIPEAQKLFKDAFPRFSELAFDLNWLDKVMGNKEYDYLSKDNIVPKDKLNLGKTATTQQDVNDAAKEKQVDKLQQPQTKNIEMKNNVQPTLSIGTFIGDKEQLMSFFSDAINDAVEKSYQKIRASEEA